MKWMKDYVINETWAPRIVTVQEKNSKLGPPDLNHVQVQNFLLKCKILKFLKT